MAHLRIDMESHRILEREGPHLEFKSCPGNIPGSTWETYSAFANTDGGTIVLGVEDDGSITGVQKPEVRKQDIWNILNNSEVVNHNILRWDDVRIEEVGGLSIIVMEVGRAERALRPVYYRRMDTGTFRRFEGGDYRCDMDEVASIIRDRCASSYDETVIEDMTVDDLDMDSVNAFRHRLRSFSPGHPWLDHSDADFMSEVGITGHATSNLTLAGLVMFGRESSIYHVLPRFKLDYLEYGENPVWDDRLVTGTGTWNGNVFNFMTSVIPRLSEPISAPYALDGGMVRKDDTLRHKAVRESVLNAVCNADYMRANPITIERSRSFIKVKNAGLFRIPLANAEQGGMSDPRNATIARMLSLIGMVERHGVGVRFIMESWGPPKPVISEDTKWSCATVVLPLGGGDTDEIALKILMYVSEKPDSTFEEIAESVGVSRATVSSRMRDLRNQGKVVREGRTKGARWRVVGGPNASIKAPRSVEGKGSRPGDRARMDSASVEFHDVGCSGYEDGGLVEQVLRLVADLVDVLQGEAHQHVDQGRFLDELPIVVRPCAVGLVGRQPLAVLQHDGVQDSHRLVLVVLLSGLGIAEADVQAVHLVPALAVAVVEDPRRGARREGERGDDGHGQDDQNLVGVHGMGIGVLGISRF